MGKRPDSGTVDAPGAEFFDAEGKIIYQPTDFYRSAAESIRLDVDIAGYVVTLPVENVGKNSPLWVAYANVKENQELARAAHAALSVRMFSVLQPMVEKLSGSQYITFMTPPSDKTVEFFSKLYSALQQGFGDSVRHVQLIGGYDETAVRRLSVPGFMFPCDSVIAKAKEKNKFIGATEDQVIILKRSKLVLTLDDIANTCASIIGMQNVANAARGEDRTYPAYVIGTESPWNTLNYPKQFPANLHAFFHLPEVAGNLPELEVKG